LRLCTGNLPTKTCARSARTPAICITPTVNSLLPSRRRVFGSCVSRCTSHSLRKERASFIGANRTAWQELASLGRGLQPWNAIPILRSSPLQSRRHQTRWVEEAPSALKVCTATATATRRGLEPSGTSLAIGVVQVLATSF
jgi:hypothetical protein